MFIKQLMGGGVTKYTFEQSCEGKLYSISQILHTRDLGSGRHKLLLQRVVSTKVLDMKYHMSRAIMGVADA